jgi:hypothetical protein
VSDERNFAKTPIGFSLAFFSVQSFLGWFPQVNKPGSQDNEFLLLDQRKGRRGEIKQALLNSTAYILAHHKFKRF